MGSVAIADLAAHSDSRNGPLCRHSFGYSRPEADIQMMQRPEHMASTKEHDSSHWAFDAPPDEAAFTVRSIIDGRKPILLVSRDPEEDDGAWSFLTGEPIDMSEALLVALRTVVERDPTVMQVAALQPGWFAQRASAGAEWVMALSPPDGDA
jgi:hypothetical protein